MERQNSYAIPIAIVIAGALIAGTILFTGDRGGSAERETSDTAGSTSLSSDTISMRPVSSDDHILGSPNADIFIVEYSDTECPFCKSFHSTMHRIIDQYGKTGEVVWVYRHFPIVQLHSKAPKEAEATECAAELGGNTGFWAYIDRLFEVTPSNDGLDTALLPEIAEEVGLDRSAFAACLESGKYTEKVEEDLKDAQGAGGRGTPFSVIVSGEKLDAETQNFIASAASQLPPRTIYISDDEQRIAVSGALPFDLLKLILDVMLDKETVPTDTGHAT